MISHPRRIDDLRRSFWLLPAIGFGVALVLGFLLPAVDDWLHIDLPVINFRTEHTASSLLQTIATASMSVVGIAFSVVVVALQLASQQLSPRVLRTFQADRMPKLVLALFVGTFVYCLVLLATLGGTENDIPELSIGVAVVAAIVTFAFFIAFIQDIVNVLQASDLIRRIATDAHDTIERRFPDDVGGDPDDLEAAEAAVRARRRRSAPRELRAPRGGYVVAVDTSVIDDLAERDALLEQCVMIGDFALSGQLLARLWCDAADDDFADRVAGAFDFSYERNVVQDIAFPLRQLADVALKGLSPGLNDPTTAENAMDSVADTLVLLARRGDGIPVRVDRDGEPRLVACAPTLNDLTRLAFDQVRVKAASYPILAERLIHLLSQIQDAARERGTDCSEAERQAALIAEAVAGEAATRTDDGNIRAAAGALD